MAASARSTGLPWHLLHPLVIVVLLSIATWTSAVSVWLASANSLTTQIRFGPRDYCGYNITVVDGVKFYDALGCIDAGWSYQVDRQAVGVALPAAVSTSLSKGAALLIWCFVVVLVDLLLQVYATRYSFRTDPNPAKPRMYTLVSLHLALSAGSTLIIWVTFITIAAICASASSYRGLDKSATLEQGGVRIWWGTSPWLVLAAGVVGLPWTFEAVRWRHAEISNM